MKIAILTLPLHGNYGGIIQNYALQTILREMGHEVRTINLKKSLLGKKYDISFLTRAVRPEMSIAKRHIRRFINEHISLTSPVYNKKDLIKADFSEFDAVVVGSDQVWRICYAYPDIYTYYLDFIKDKRIKKIALSASFGTDTVEYSDEQIRRCGEYIKDFDIVTVREDSALNLINNAYRWTCGKPPVQTLDPTMLLTKEHYTELTAKYYNKDNSGRLFYYVLDMTEEKRNLINRISADLGIKPFTVMRKTHRWYKSLKDKTIPPLEEWLEAFHQASYIFTDSFHGCVFSILFNKEFIAFGNKKRGMNRFHSLLRGFNLLDRLICSEEEFDSGLYERTIDWTSVNSTLDNERAKAKACLELLND